MLLVDFVARSQEGGATKAELPFIEDSKEVETTLRGIPKAYYDYLMRDEEYKDLTFGAERSRNCKEVNADQGADNLAKFGPYLCLEFPVISSNRPTEKITTARIIPVKPMKMQPM